MISPTATIEYYSHYRREFIRSSVYKFSERQLSRSAVRGKGLNADKLTREVYLGLRSADSAQNNFYVLVRFAGEHNRLLDLSNGKVIAEFEEKRVLRFPRKKKKQ